MPSTSVMMVLGSAFYYLERFPLNFQFLRPLKDIQGFNMYRSYTFLDNLIYSIQLFLVYSFYV